jgi:hypothetical protein
MKIALMTSFNQSYYDSYGKYLVNSFIKYWPKEVTLYVYNEDMNFVSSASNVKSMGFDLGENYKEFNSRDHKPRIKVFAKKAFSWLHACKNIEADRIIWIDSDCQTIKKVPLSFIESICPNDKLTAHMGIWYHDKKTREGNVKLDVPIYCPETGFNVINKTHPLFKTFIETYEDYYMSDKGTQLRRFYDNDVFGAVVKTLPDKNFVELNPDFHKTPMRRTILGEYFEHYKGKVKKQDSFSIKIK